MAAPVSMPVLRGLDQGLPSHVSVHKSGGRDQWSDPLASAPADPLAAAHDCLREVLDPEIPISVLDLGLIYDVRWSSGLVEVDLTFTATACPCMEFIKEDVSDRLLQESWIDDVRLHEVWDPPWTTDRITPAGRDQLRRLGVGVG